MRELLEFNRYTHDFTAAMWVCGSILVWLMWREMARSRPTDETLHVVRGLCGKVTAISVPALVISLMAGGVRAITFRQYEFVGEITTTLIVALAIKHVLFVVFVIWGISVHMKARRLGVTPEDADAQRGSLREVRS